MMHLNDTTRVGQTFHVQLVQIYWSVNSVSRATETLKHCIYQSCQGLGVSVMRPFYILVIMVKNENS